MPNSPTPEELRRTYQEDEECRERIRLAKRLRFLKKWIWISGAIGLMASLMNYLDLRSVCLAHFFFSGLCGYLLLQLRRGHLTGMALVGIGNECISISVGFFNPFGLVAFCVAGAVIGLGQKLEQDLQ